MIGTIITDVNVHFPDGKLAWGARVGDKVKGAGGNTITELSRHGVVKLATLGVGSYSLAQSGCVAWDTVTPPPEPTGPTYPEMLEVRPLNTDGTLGEAKRYKIVINGN